MIVVKVEVHPFGDSTRPKHLGMLRIVNTGEGIEAVGEYTYEIYDGEGEEIASGMVHKFPRTKLTAWDLVARVLEQTHGKGIPCG